MSSLLNRTFFWKGSNFKDKEEYIERLNGAYLALSSSPCPSVQDIAPWYLVAHKQGKVSPSVNLEITSQTQSCVLLNTLDIFSLVFVCLEGVIELDIRQGPDICPLLTLNILCRLH